MRLALLTLLLAACAPTMGTEGESQSAITGGAGDSGDSSVVLVHGRSADGSMFLTCTGSIVAPRAVLTAAHCFDDSTLTYSIGLEARYDFADATTPNTELYPITSHLIDPAYDSTTLPHPHDLAIANVATDLGASLPYYQAAPSQAWVDEAVRLVGYGKTSAKSQDEGTRRSVSTTIASISDDELVVTSGKQDCGGDSGGPALMTLDGVETIVGVASAATSNCQTTGYYSRIDGDIDFINGAISGSTVLSTSTPSSDVAHNGGCNEAGGSPSFMSLVMIALYLVACCRA